MKILNIFKKETLKNMISEKSKVQVLDKKQLEKVIGGAETFTTAHEAEHVKQQTTK